MCTILCAPYPIFPFWIFLSIRMKVDKYVSFALFVTMGRLIHLTALLNKRVIFSYFRACLHTSRSRILASDLIDLHIKFISVQDTDGISRRVRVFDSHANNASSSSSSFPLLLLGGTGQTISTYVPHIKHLSRGRRLVIPELRCQGRHTELISLNSTVEQVCA